jgi:hypothetical protein
MVNGCWSVWSRRRFTPTRPPQRWSFAFSMFMQRRRVNRLTCTPKHNCVQRTRSTTDFLRLAPLITLSGVGMAALAGRKREGGDCRRELQGRRLGLPCRGSSLTSCRSSCWRTNCCAEQTSSNQTKPRSFLPGSGGRVTANEGRRRR